MSCLHESILFSAALSSAIEVGHQRSQPLSSCLVEIYCYAIGRKTILAKEEPFCDVQWIWFAGKGVAEIVAFIIHSRSIQGAAVRPQRPVECHTRWKTTSNPVRHQLCRIMLRRSLSSYVIDELLPKQSE